jgi:serine/threonine-protein phosphatase 2A regulatory subunit B
VLHSLEIGEKIKRVRWCARPNRSLCMLATNDRTVKLWKVLNTALTMLGG